MGKLTVDVDQLERLSRALAGLAAESRAIESGPATTYISGPGGVLASLTAAQDITHHLIRGVLLPSISERLANTGSVMAAVANSYRGQEDANAADLAQEYLAGTGDWSVEQA